MSEAHDERDDYWQEWAERLDRVRLGRLEAEWARFYGWELTS